MIHEKVNAELIDRELSKPIALGRTAEIYAWEPGWVLKLYFDWFNADGAAFEQRIAAAIHATGLPVPAVGEILQIGERVGLLYEHCSGIPMAEDLAKHPWRIVSYARLLAKLHAEMHAGPMRANIPGLHPRLEHKIRAAKPLPEELRSAVLQELKKMPGGNRLCHGDFHPGNILLSQPGATVIDWIDASIGNPLADLARTSILLQGLIAVRSQRSWSEFIGIHILHAVYLRRYFQLRPGGMDEYRRWLPIVAAARLSEGIIELDSWLLTQAGKLSQTNHLQ